MSEASAGPAGRDRFLERVRQAVAVGNRAGNVPDLPARQGVGYQGAGSDPVACFCAAWTAAGGFVQRVPDRAAAAARALELVQARGARQVLLDGSAESLGLAARFAALGIESRVVSSLGVGDVRDRFFAADVGISGADFLIAETGSLAMRARPEEPRSLSLLPPVHIVVAEVAQIVPDLFDLFDRIPTIPSCLTLITGPSKTGDIELRLVTGVHGPVVLIDGADALSSTHR
jgi:L-lactate dehydrogenase complex protein LldG